MHLELAALEEERPLQTPKVSARLVAATHLLELSADELEQAIHSELSTNPALDIEDLTRCPICGCELERSICPNCVLRQRSPVSQPSADEDGYDRLAHVGDEDSLADRLQADLSAALPEADAPIAEFLVGSLDDSGYLRMTAADVAYELSVETERVSRAIKLLQGLEPFGFGSRNAREFLLLQLEALADKGVQQPYARELVSGFLAELSEHRFARIAAELRVPVAVVEDAREFIIKHLSPSPAHGMDIHSPQRHTRDQYVVPEVTISRGSEGSFEISVVERYRWPLRVNAFYVELLRAALAGTASLDPEEVAYLRGAVAHAQMFIRNIAARHTTLERVTRAIVEAQREYLDEGVLSIKPLTRAEIAHRVGLHESTVSRATASKYALLPNGHVVPFATFFTPNLGVKHVLEEIVANEGEPLSDVRIVQRLEAHGVHVARRTVTKYRSQLGILPSSMRLSSSARHRSINHAGGTSTLSPGTETTVSGGLSESQLLQAHTE